jgi:hypothetical protein
MMALAVRQTRRLSTRASARTPAGVWIGLVMQSLSLFLGLVVMVIATATFATGMSPSQILGWSLDMLGGGFLLLLSALVITAMFCCVQLINSARHAQPDLERQKWVQAGLQSCNGIATLALTFTLLGISLGIGQLSNSSLTPDSIDKVIATLTDDFSMAFLTSVIGLPLSAILRTVLIVLNASLALDSMKLADADADDLADSAAISHS